MKRDMDLYREILLACEKETDGKKDVYFKSDKHGYEFSNEHIYLMRQDGFLEAEQYPDTDDPDIEHWAIKRLTTSGHDFLDSIRDPETWRNTKEGALAARGWTLELLKDLAKGIIRNQIENLSGMKLL